MTRWAAFVGLTGVVVSLVVLLAHLSQRLLEAEPTSRTTAVRVQPTGVDPGVADSRWVRVRPFGRSQAPDLVEADSDSPSSIPTLSLLVNVMFTQGSFSGILLVGAWYFEVPLSAVGITFDPLSTGLPAVDLGIVLGIGLWIGSELAVTLVDAAGIGYDQQVRSMLTPTTTGEWILLLGVVLPIVAASEEFIFRAAAIGVPATGLETSPWALAVVSSLAFGVAHGAQGRAGVVVTGLLGMALATTFVLTESLLVVILAHYVLNALEFLVTARGYEPRSAVGITRQ